jgi:hypothetical protein
MAADRASTLVLLTFLELAPIIRTYNKRVPCNPPADFTAVRAKKTAAPP